MCLRTNPKDTLKRRSTPNDKTPLPTERQRKLAIYNRLLEYRRKNGLGSVAILAQAAKVSDAIIYAAIGSMPLPFDTWEKIGRGLDKLATSATKKKAAKKSKT